MERKTQRHPVAVAPPTVSVTLPFMYTDAEWAVVNSLHGGYKVQSTRQPKNHGHPVLATERFIAIQFMVRRLIALGAAIVDVGAGGRSRVPPPRLAWVVEPLLSPADAVNSVFTAPRANSCRHRLEECDCVADDGNVRGLLASHVMYYLQPQTVLEFMLRSGLRTGMYCVHTMDTQTGSYYGEANWATVGGRVRMTVVGGETYEHPPPGVWATSGSYTSSSAVRRRTHTLAWSLDTCIGQTAVFKIALLQGAVPGLTMSLDSFTATTIDGDELEVVRGDKHVHVDGCVIPRQLVDHLASYLLGKKRDNAQRIATLSEARAFVRGNPKDLRSLNEQQISMAVVSAFIIAQRAEKEATGALNRVAGVFTETKQQPATWDPLPPINPLCCCLGRPYQRFKMAWRDWRRSGEDGPRISKRAIRVAALGAMPATVKADDGEGSSWLPLAILIALMLVLCAVAVDARPSERREASLPVVYKTNSRKPPAPTIATVEYTPVDWDDDQPKPFVVAVSEPLFEVGLSANANTNSNITLALGTRIAPADLPRAAPAAMLRYQAWFRANMPAFFSGKPRPYGDELQEFNRWKVRYDQAKQRRLDAAFDQLRQNDRRGLHRKGLFIKAELSFGKLDPEGFNVSNPRGIVSGSDKYNAYVGPRVAKVQKWFATHYDRKRITIAAKKMETYSENLNRAIRLAQEEAYRLLDEDQEEWVPVIIETDFTTYDATQDVGKSELHVSLYRIAGADDALLQTIKQTIRLKRVANFDGFQAEWPGTMGSGEPDTWLRNTIGNIAHTHYAHEAAGGRVIHGMFSGDDSVVVALVRREVGRHDHDNYRDRLDGISRSLGLVAKTKIISHFTDVVGFCSHQFMPTSQGYALLPSPARTIIKINLVQVHHLRPWAQVSGNIVGQWDRLSRTPIVRAYSQALYRLAQTHDKRREPPERFTFNYAAPHFDMADSPPPLDGVLVSMLEDRCGLVPGDVVWAESAVDGWVRGVLPLSARARLTRIIELVAAREF